MEEFAQKQRQWAWLLGNIGISSGQFARHLSNGVSCQTLEAQPRRRRRASTPKSTPNPTPKKVEPPSPPPQAPPAHVPSPPPPPPPASLVAPGFQEVDMTSPLTEAEAEIAGKVKFWSKGSKFQQFQSA